jgi:hypothetical protein
MLCYSINSIAPTQRASIVPLLLLLSSLTFATVDCCERGGGTLNITHKMVKRFNMSYCNVMMDVGDGFIPPITEWTDRVNFSSASFLTKLGRSDECPHSRKSNFTIRVSVSSGQSIASIRSCAM